MTRRTPLPVVLVVTVASLVPLTGAGTATAGARTPASSALERSHQIADPELPSQALYSWGSNDWGQLGQGTSGGGSPTPVPQPGAVATPPGVPFRSVSAGGAHALGLTTTGQIYAWGSGASGQLGLGSHAAARSPQPVTVPGQPVVAIAAGSSHSVALDASGQVYAWGSNFSGQLGDGSAAAADTPTPVVAPPGVTFTGIAAGGDHTIALSATGQVYAWGANGDGQLGDGGTDPSDVPVRATAPAGVTFTAIAAGTAHSLALSTTGEVYAWGFNASGQLGDETTADSAIMTPVTLPAGATVTTIAAGASHSLALTSTGVVLAWGSNVFGQLGSALAGSVPADSTVPIQPPGLPPLTSFVAIGGGLSSSYALTSAGVAWTWGGDAYGQLGGGTPGLDAVAPAPVAALPPGTLATGLFSGPDASAAYLVSRADQGVTYPPLPSPTYGDPPVDVAPSAGSGLPLTNTSTGACAGPLVRLSLVSAGLCTVSTTQPGNFWFYPASSSASFAVGRAILSVTPDDATGTAGALPPLGYRLSGFANRDTASAVTGAATCTTPATAASLPGSYPITCGTGTLSSTDYSFVTAGTGVLTLRRSPSGYAVIGHDGSVWALGPARESVAPSPAFFGSLAGRRLNAPVVGAAFTPLHDGYWLAASDGGVFTFGSAGFYGSMGGRPLNRPIVGMTSTPDGGGYWLVASDGGIFAFGDAAFYGSTGSIALNEPIVGMTSTTDGGGYWMVASDGGIFAFGDAAFYGSTGATGAGQSIVGMAATPGGDGYWMTTASGAVFNFGGAAFEGSLRYIDLNEPVVGITSTSDGGGYWLAGADGGVFAFGDAGYFGRATPPPGTIDGII